MAALVALTVVDVLHTIIAVAEYEHRITVVDHDGSALADMLNTVVPLRELSSAMLWLLLLTLLVASATVISWAVRTLHTAPPAASAPPAVSAPPAASAASIALLRFSAIGAVTLNPLAVAQYLSASAHRGEYMRAVRTETYLLLVAAAVAVVISTIVGIQVVRRITADRRRTAGVGTTTG